MDEEKPKRGRPPKPVTAPVKLFCDYWVSADDRRKAGTVIDLPTDEARRLVSIGKAERADPMPGEE